MTPSQSMIALMKKKSLALLFALSLLIGWLGTSPAIAQDETEASDNDACDLVREETLDWTALGETVTFRTEMSGETYGLPGAAYTLIRADGTEIALGGGGKFIDEADVPCAEHLEAARARPLEVPYNERETRSPYTMTIRDYLTGTTREEVFSDIECLAVEVERGRLRETRPDRSDEAAYRQHRQAERANDYAEAKCRERRQMQETFKDTPDTLVHLIAINAPLLDITGSTYFGNIVALDPETNTLHELFFWGC